MTVINLHLCKSFKYFCKMWHIRKIEFGINTLHIHIHRKCNNIYITCSLTITKKVFPQFYLLLQEVLTLHQQHLSNGHYVDEEK